MAAGHRETGATSGAAGGASARRAPRPGGISLGHVRDVTHHGAIADGRTLCTRAIQGAIDASAAAGGGMVLLPPGRYLCGALFLRSHVQLEVAAGATLLGSERFDDYPPIASRWEGIERKTHASLLTGIDLENVAITGAGVIDGQGLPWWQAHEVTRRLRLDRGLPRTAENPPGAPLRWPRPRAINLIRCQGVALAGVTVRNSPSWNVHALYCQDVFIDGVTIDSLEAKNCDGIVIDSCKQVRIASCSIAAGSEGISLKSGYNEDGRRVGLPCEDVVITNCNMHMSFGSGVAIGSETAGGIRNVAVSNCVMTSCRTGVYIKSPRGRGGVVERIRVSSVVMDGIEKAAILISTYFDSVRLDNYRGPPAEGDNPETDRRTKLPISEGTPTLRDLEFSDLTLGQVPEVAIIEGLPERFIQGVTIENVTATRARAGISCQRAADVTISGLSVNPSDGPAINARDVEGLEIHRLRCTGAPKDGPLVRLDHVAGAFIHGCDVTATAERFVEQQGTGNREVALAGNNLRAAPGPG
jgi:polygalacturonase